MDSEGAAASVVSGGYFQQSLLIVEADEKTRDGLYRCLVRLGASASSPPKVTSTSSLASTEQDEIEVKQREVNKYLQAVSTRFRNQISFLSLFLLCIMVKVRVRLKTTK